ncbi:MAG: ABC transporter ATP-binding protein, partial [Calditerricola sp.]|nr:ABC transporter ATP-binding protein [Calditerricola sp.]
AHAAKGGSVLMSTHLMFLAEELCDRVVILSRGKRVAAGTLASLRARAGDEQATLEELFLELTRNGTEV